MTENLIARPYAKALFELALTENKLESWYSALAEIAIIAADLKIKAMLKSPKAVRNEAMDLLNEFSLNDVLFKRFILVLHEELRLQYLPEIFSTYEKLYLQHHATVAVLIKTVLPLSKETQLVLTKKLEVKFAKKIQITSCIDEDIIAGMVIEVPEFDLVIDDSVRGKLQQLSANLIM